MRTIVVDDDPVFLAVAEGILRSLGISEITTETDVTSALMAIEEVDEKFDLLLLDLNMPNLDGLAALRKLSDSDFDGNIVVVSGERESILSSARHIAKQLGLNVCGALNKPIQIEKLNEAINAAREASSSSRPERSYLQPLPKGPLQPILHYQAQVDLIDGAIFGAEALLRSSTREGLLLGPEALLIDNKLPEKRIKLTTDLFSMLCTDAKRLTDAGRQQRIALNVDASVVERRDFVPMIKSIANHHGVNCEKITFELTEAQLPDDSTALLEALARLRMSGFEISMDDFGTGVSNFELLRKGPFSEMKIDRSIVNNAATDKACLEFIEYAITVSKNLDIRLIAEGVEEKNELDLMMNLGISKMQGYYFGKAENFRNLIKRLEKYDKNNKIAS